MNDVIEKIMDKADAVEILADEDFCDTDFLADMDPLRVAVFAELIVQECITAIQNNKANLTIDSFSDAVWEIKDRFGVK
jgi:hypothetical protein